MRQRDGSLVSTLSARLLRVFPIDLQRLLRTASPLPAGERRLTAQQYAVCRRKPPFGPLIVWSGKPWGRRAAYRILARSQTEIQRSGFHGQEARLLPMERERHGHGGSLVDYTLDAQCSAMSLRDALADREPKAGAAIRTGAGRIDTIESFSKMRQVFGGDPTTGIDDCDRCHLTDGSDRNR